MKRFWDKVEVKSESECWEWVAHKNQDGYGVFLIDGKNKKAHRVSWVITNGEIPEGLCVCHKCDNRSCINPEHLFLGTNKDNTQDMIAKGRNANQKKTHCPQGHEYNIENTYIRKNGSRDCRGCSRKRAARSYYIWNR